MWALALALTLSTALVGVRSQNSFSQERVQALRGLFSSWDLDGSPLHTNTRCPLITWLCTRDGLLTEAEVRHLCRVPPDQTTCTPRHYGSGLPRQVQWCGRKSA
jgi:hypothetical protein